MKKNILLASLLILLLSSKAQKIVNGNKSIESKEYSVGSFNEASLTITTSLEVRYSTTNKISIESDQNILTNIVVENKSGQISIGAIPGKWLEPSYIKVVIYTSNLTAIRTGKKNSVLLSIPDNEGGANFDQIKLRGKIRKKSEEIAGVEKSEKIGLTNKGENKIRIELINKGTKPKKFVVQYPAGGDYGIGVASGETLIEMLPIGAKIYNKRLLWLLQKPLLLVVEPATMVVQ